MQRVASRCRAATCGAAPYTAAHVTAVQRNAFGNESVPNASTCGAACKPLVDGRRRTAPQRNAPLHPVLKKYLNADHTLAILLAARQGTAYVYDQYFSVGIFLATLNISYKWYRITSLSYTTNLPQKN